MHEIWHGDSRELCAVIPENSVNCIITDPPFGIDAISNQAVTEQGKKYARKIANDETPEQALEVFSQVMDTLLPKSTPDADMYVFTAWSVLDSWIPYIKSLEASHGFVYKNMLIWEKNGASMGDLNSWGTSYEVIFFLKKGKRERTDKRRPGVINVPQVSASKLIHPHEKPLALLEILMKHSTSEGDFVIDPFGGSGSLVRAARDMNRNALAIEYNEENYIKAKRALDETVSLFA